MNSYSAVRHIELTTIFYNWRFSEVELPSQSFKILKTLWNTFGHSRDISSSLPCPIRKGESFLAGMFRCWLPQLRSHHSSLRPDWRGLHRSEENETMNAEFGFGSVLVISSFTSLRYIVLCVSFYHLISGNSMGWQPIVHEKMMSYNYDTFLYNFANVSSINIFGESVIICHPLYKIGA